MPCAVLEDGTRVLSQRAFTGALSAPQGGQAFAKRAAQGVADLPIFLADEALRPFISMELAASLASPIEYLPMHGGRSAFGIKAELVPAVCDVWLKAREAGALTRKHQERVAYKAEVLMRALAHVAIVALVDEAKLLHHLGKVTALMAISPDWNAFRQLVDKHIPIHKALPLLEGQDD